jgi:hypothetical protein
MRATSVMDHRMVLALSSARTTLWDQVRFAGNPKQFLWILPVTSGSRVEIAVGSNAFIDALDDLSAPLIVSPTATCDDAGVAGYTQADAAAAASGEPVVTSTSERSNLGSTGRATVGPYAAELVRAERGSLIDWLRTRSFSVTDESATVIRHYESTRSDFVVVQFRPGASVQQMQPIRVSTDGYNPVLPLRFAAIGAGENVGLSLMVIAPTAVAPDRWPMRVIRDDELTWDFRARSSDYPAVLSATFAAPERPWVIESTTSVSITELLARLSAGPMLAARLPERGVIPADCPFPDEQIEPLRGPEADGGCAGDVCEGAEDASAQDGDSGATSDAAVDPRCVAQPSSVEQPTAEPASDPANLAQAMRSGGVLTRLHIRLGATGFARDLTLGAADPSMVVAVTRALSKGINGCVDGRRPRAIGDRSLRDPGCACSSVARGSSSARWSALVAMAAALALRSRRRRAHQA